MTGIDAHQHYWHPARGDYGWMPADDPVLSRPYGPKDLAAQLAAAGIQKTLLVQAAPSEAETEYLLGLADATETIAAVVGWIDFENPASATSLKRFAAHPKFVGVRPMIQDIADDDWMLKPEIQWAYEAIINLGLTFDCLGFPRHLSNFLTLLSRYPDMPAVIDHCMKPQLRAHSEQSYTQWSEGITQLAGLPQVFCKLSGLVTEADTDWSNDVLAPYTHHVLTSFGPERTMWGSDWPVLRLRCEYDSWHQQAQALTSHLQSTEQNQIFGDTASRFYKLD